MARIFGQSTADVVPGLSGADLYMRIPVQGRQHFRFLLDIRTKRVSRHTLERVAGIAGVELPQWTRTVLRTACTSVP